MTPTAILAYMPTEHVPVMGPEMVALLAPSPGEIAVDCTFGGGGHARMIADRIGPTGTLICLDRDPVAEGRYQAFAAERRCQTRFVRGNFAEGLQTLAGEGVVADMVYMDLGMSSLQLDAWERGFSYSYDAPLDMRMDPEQQLTAAEVANGWPQSRIAKILRQYGEERYSGPIAREIVARRPIQTTSELVDAIKAGIPASAGFGGGHPAKRTFQAIRIAVNGEIEAIESGIPRAWNLLRPGGRFASIAFHSLEDRPVKRFLSNLADGCVCPPEFPVCVCGFEPGAQLLTRGAVAAGPGEAAENPRARSARLRAAVKLRTDPRAEGGN